MMIHSQSITIEGQECVLLIIPPDWAGGVQARVQMRSETLEAVTGIQERRREHAAPRIQMRYQTILTDAALQTLRTVLGGLGDKRVAVPYWPDVQNTLISVGIEQTDWNNRALAGQINVGWDGDFQNVTVTTGNTAPARNFRGALLVGRLGRTAIKALTQEIGNVEVSFAEDANWNSRVEPRATDPETWQAAWEPNWIAQPEQGQRSLSQYKQLGRGRESAVEGTEDVRLWTQQAKLMLAQDAAAGLISFFVGRGGSTYPFVLPSALQPGNSTPAAPHTFDASNGRVRFTDRELSIDYLTPKLSVLTLQLEQQVETETQSQTPAAFAYLYRFTYEGEILHLTDWESPISAAGATWAPARIEHGRLKQSLKPQNEDCEIDAYIDDIPLIEPFVRLELETPAHVEIYEMLLPAGTPQQLFTGSIQKARVKGKEVKLKAAAFGGALDRRVPRFQWSVNCNHTLFSHGCVRRRPTEMAKENFRAVGYYEAQWPDPKLLLNTVTYPGGTPKDTHYYVGGWIETGTGTARQVREIRGSWHIEDMLHLLLARPIRTDQIAPGQAFHVYPGCDGQHSTCYNKFSNTLNFGGFPFMPEWIEQAPSSFPKTGK
jgi:uncharacterized phage protein (TIGR02218 family)